MGHHGEQLTLKWLREDNVCAVCDLLYVKTETSEWFPILPRAGKVGFWQGRHNGLPCSAWTFLGYRTLKWAFQRSESITEHLLRLDLKYKNNCVNVCQLIVCHNGFPQYLTENCL